MTSWRRRIFLPYLNDYEGGYAQPAFTNREACERHVSDLNRLHRTSEYSVDEMLLLDSAPAIATFYNRSGHVHWDGFECVEGNTATQQRFDFDLPDTRLTTEHAYGVRINLWRADDAQAERDYRAELEAARIRVAGIHGRQAQSCGVRCTHPTAAYGVRL